VALIAWKGGT